MGTQQKIITLPKQLANQIAAGEVVERPLSVVKELVENSLDAGAKNIRVELEEGGIEYICVQDDGLGIPEDDLAKALEKYSTSKIRSLDDLYKVMTFGFRGEALASISSVSEFTISSKTKDQISGKKIISEGGENITQEITAHNVGTKVEVSRLFFNTPARKAYLKTPRTEYQKISDFIQKMALCYPDTSFSLWHDGKEVFHFSLGESIESRIYKIAGKEFYENMLSIEAEFGGLKISGYITDPKISYQNKTRQTLFVNNRLIQSPMIQKAITDGYNRFIAPKTFPGYVVFLDLDPTQIDANVHPRKMEIRFAGEQQIYRSVYHAVKDELERVSLSNVNSLNYTLYAASLSPAQTPSRCPKGRKENIYHISSGTRFKNYSPYTNTQADPAQAGLEFNRAILGENASQDTPQNSIGRVVGQVHNAYIIVETEDGLKVLDQHALAERVIYEQLAHSAYIPKVQQLIGTTNLDLTTQEKEIYENYIKEFEKMGFTIVSRSSSEISISAIPDFVSRQNIEKMFRGILEDISSQGSKTLDEVRHRIWAYTACRSAVKFGDSLTQFEMEKLLYDASIEYSATCPHGRPVVYDISLEELLGKYER